MAYYPYQNQYYNYTPAQFPNNQASSQSGIIWIQGEQAAKSYMVAPNTTVLLMDSESQRFYLKSSDASGMPLPLRVFEYTETTQNGTKTASDTQAVDYSSFATKAEFEAFRDEIHNVLKNIPRSRRREAEEDA